jgi:OOP family OmpA-OmpF porin
MVNLDRALCVVCMLAGLVTLDAVAADFDGSKDHPLMTRYPGSQITEYNQVQYGEYTLPLGIPQDGHFAKSQHLEGKVTRIRYEIPEGRSSLEVFRNYQGALQRGGFASLFTCSGDGQCGNGQGLAEWSASWCGGCSPRQVSARLSRPEGDVYVSVHVEQDNPSTRAQTQMDVVEIKPMDAGLVSVNAESLARDISHTGHVSVYGIYFDTGKADVKPESDATLKEIAKLLQQDPKLSLYVVGHTDNVGALASNMDLSRRRATAVAQALTTTYGIPAARLNAQGAGPLAPVASNDGEAGRTKNRRVELVKQ